MRKQNTVFILGAGASVPYGFPTSKGLRKDIIDNFSRRYSPFIPQGDAHKDSVKRNQITHVNEFKRYFNLSSIFSIDYFIARNPRFIDFGKDAIILHLLEFKKNSKFRQHTKIEHSDWYSFLYNYMISEARSANSFSKISNNHLSFLTFNYDRSLEHFLIESLSHSFENIHEDDIEQILLNNSIYHIYGSISDLPSKNSKGLEYGGNVDFKELSILQQNILTIGDKFKINDDILDIIYEADRIFFLGFGFDKINLINLRISQNLRPNQKIYATVYGLNNKFISDLKEFFISEHFNFQQKQRIKEPEKLNPDYLIIENVKALNLL